MRSLLLPVIPISCFLFACAGAAALTIDSGLADYQVVQCDDAGKAALTFAGTSTASGALEARVMGVQKEIIPWTSLGQAAGGAWQGSLPGVPVGGPYRVEVHVKDAAGAVLESTSVLEVLVGDLWIMGGQSNMHGVGNRMDMESPHPMVHTFAMNYEWRLAQDPLHTLAESPDKAHNSFPTEEDRQKDLVNWRDGTKGAGCGITFAKEMYARTGRPVGLIASAHGGTSLGQWDPALKDQGGASQYGSMFKQVQAAGGKVRGMIWYQGESDANPEPQKVYREKMKQFVAALRADFGANMPFYYVQISRFTANPDMFHAWNEIQTDQLALEAELAPCALVPAVDLSLDDGIHIGTQGLKTLGYRLAVNAERDLFGGKVQRGPRLLSTEQLGTPYGNQVRVKFTSVNGALKAAGRAYGFSISDGPTGLDSPSIYNQEIDPAFPDTVIIWFENMPANPCLWYGRGLNPYCNITDEANMPVPVMGPIPLNK